MHTQTKTILKSALIGGGFYGVGMAIFDFINGADFNVWKFILHTLLFGIFMGLWTNYSLRKRKNKKQTE